MANNEFHNPYHFVPVLKVGEQVKEKRWSERTAFEQKNCAPLHQRFAPDRLSGRIICRLTTKTPVFVGAQRILDATRHNPAEVAPFELQEKPAIPASSLRGMISSIAEAASQSAMRVLEDRALSYRKKAEEALPALGMMFRETDATGNSQWKIQPLTLPCLEKDEGTDNYILPKHYRKWYPAGDGPRLKVYFNQRFTNKGRRRLKYTTFQLDRPRYWYMHLDQALLLDKKYTLQGISSDNAGQSVTFARNPRGGGRNHNIIVAQKPLQGGSRLPSSEIKGESRNSTRGILRVMSAPNRNLPGMRKHEIFIPYPEGAEKWPKFSVSQEVVDRFHRLADERTLAEKDTKDPLPFSPFNIPRNTKKDEQNRFRLKEGDIVFFRPDPAGERIEEISLSSIWRDGPRDEGRIAGVHRFFREIDPEQLPFTSGRNWISPAERVFGFVEERGKHEESGTKDALAQKGLVRFSHALLEVNKGNDRPYLDPVTLRILDSPKPPSPALYFREKDGNGYIAKADLTVGSHLPQGRKMYLHHRDKEVTGTPKPWETLPKNSDKNLKQKVRITPVEAEQTFWFSVDFDNLDHYELGMLCYALQPSPEFSHKLGMGKPLGLGSVTIEPAGLWYVDRQKRYCSEDPFAGAFRYHLGDCREIVADIPPWLYPCFDATAKLERENTFTRLREEFCTTLHPDVARALELLGGAVTDCPVHTPRASERGDPEQKTYQWWVNNDKNRKEKGLQNLKPIGEKMPTLPPLKYF